MNSALIELDHAYKQKDWEQLLELTKIVKPENKRELALFSYYQAMALYRKKEFKKALDLFIESLNVDEPFEFSKNLPLNIAYSAFNAQMYFLACKELEKIITLHIKNVEIVKLLTLSYVLNNESEKAKALLVSVKALMSTRSFAKLLASCYRSLLKKSNFDQRKSFNSVLYDVKIAPPTKQTQAHSQGIAYVLTQPLIGRAHFLENKERECGCLFIRQNVYYSYFMLDFDLLFFNICEGIAKLRASRVILLSSSAGAYFSILLSLLLSKKFPKIYFTVHAFAPQTNVNSNMNIKYVPHYRDLTTLLDELPELKENTARYGDLLPLLLKDNIRNVKINIYYGEKCIVDAKEALHLESSELCSFIKLKGFPFHNVLPLYRSKEEKLSVVYRGFNALLLPNGEKQNCDFSLEQCLELKRKMNCNLKTIIDLIDL